jgi:hypothetical protein
LTALPPASAAVTDHVGGSRMTAVAVASAARAPGEVLARHPAPAHDHQLSLRAGQVGLGRAGGVAGAQRRGDAHLGGPAAHQPAQPPLGVRVVVHPGVVVHLGHMVEVTVQVRIVHGRGQRERGTQLRQVVRGRRPRRLGTC